MKVDARQITSVLFLLVYCPPLWAFQSQRPSRCLRSFYPAPDSPFSKNRPYHGAPPSTRKISSRRVDKDAVASSTATRMSMASTVGTWSASLHANPSYCLTALFLLSTFGIRLEQSTRIGKALSAPLATMALALVASNTGMIPFASPMYNMVNTHLVGLAVPMLLMDSNQLRQLFQRNQGINATKGSQPNLKSLLGAFFVGTLATVAATLLVFPLVPLRSLSADAVGGAAARSPVGWKIACALAARHIGGAINFVAVAETLSIPGTVVSAAIAADNVVVALYFAMLFALAKPENGSGRAEAEEQATVVSRSELEFKVVDSVAGQDDRKDEITLSSIGMALSTSSGIVTIGSLLTKAILPKGTSSLPLSSLLTVLAASIFPNYFSRIRAAGSALGILAIQLFFAASGAAGSIALVMQQAPSLFAFSALQILVHFSILMGLGRGLLRLPSRELYLASNACVGGPTTAAAMATAKEWKQLILPALWIGILGYAIATALALALGPILLKVPLLR